MKNTGFTLVEMLVALALFAVIATIGVGLLRGSVDTQSAVQVRLGAMADVNRLRAIMANDLDHGVLRPTRSVDGAVRPAFIGDADGFALVHAGRTSFAASRLSSVQRVSYSRDGANWRRAAPMMADGMADGAGDILIDDLTAVRLRYRNAAGAWLDRWDSTETQQSPRAVDVELTRRGRAPLRLVLLAGPVPVNAQTAP